jgi:hypothetical protein
MGLPASDRIISTTNGQPRAKGPFCRHKHYHREMQAILRRLNSCELCYDEETKCYTQRNVKKSLAVRDSQFFVIYSASIFFTVHLIKVNLRIPTESFASVVSDNS